MTRADKLLCWTYALIAAVALLTTWSNNLAFLAHPENWSVASWVRALYVNPAAASFVNDLFGLGVAATLFMIVEARRFGVRHLWFYLLISPLLAISVAFPLFLIARQRVLAQQRVQRGVGEGRRDEP
jgi:phosphate/sulfate permease